MLRCIPDSGFAFAKEECDGSPLRSVARHDLVRWEFVPGPEAKIHVLTHGLHYASAVFEGERAYGGTIFKSTEHSERLKRSANILDFEIPYASRKSTPPSSL